MRSSFKCYCCYRVGKVTALELHLEAAIHGKCSRMLQIPHSQGLWQAVKRLVQVRLVSSPGWKGNPLKTICWRDLTMIAQNWPNIQVIITMSGISTYQPSSTIITIQFRSPSFPSPGSDGMSASDFGKHSASSSSSSTISRSKNCRMIFINLSALSVSPCCLYLELGVCFGGGSKHRTCWRYN